MPRDMIESGNEPRPARDVWQAMLRGFSQRCPKCGKGTLFHSYLKVNDACGVCGEELHHQRADDAPPYFTIMIVGHFVVGGLLSMEKAFAPPMGVHSIVWLPLTRLSSLWLLPRVKGALIGLQWALFMHGFEDAWRPGQPKPIARPT
jgi:uncharacterized protein (DUF983 family)